MLSKRMFGCLDRCSGAALIVCGDDIGTGGMCPSERLPCVLSVDLSFLGWS
jgi:hypothetical protein